MSLACDLTIYLKIDVDTLDDRYSKAGWPSSNASTGTMGQVSISDGGKSIPDGGKINPDYYNLPFPNSCHFLDNPGEQTLSCSRVIWSFSKESYLDNDQLCLY